MDRSILFTPLALKRITLPGRLIRSATELFCSTPDAHVPTVEIEVYRRLGRQPLGMILTAHTCVTPEGRANLRQNAIWDDSFLPDAEAVAKAGKAGGVPVVIQIGHGGMKAEGNNGGLPVYTPDNMTREQIRSLVRSFGEAALRARKAGMDGIMLHGAHLYLLSQFFYPKFNHRSDAYGGSALNRFRIIREIMEEVLSVCGASCPLFLKINGDDEGNTEEFHRELVEALRSAEDLLDAVEISGWTASSGGSPKRPYFIENVKRLCREIRIPIIEVGGFRSAPGMLEAIEGGACAVSLSRPLLCEPDFPEKLRDREDAVSRCLGCGYCYKPFDDARGIRCPQAGRILPE